MYLISGGFLLVLAIVALRLIRQGRR
jgi:hypothetical protein